MTPEPDLLTLSEAAALTGRAHSVIHGWSASGAMVPAGRRKGNGGMWADAFRRADVLRLDAERERNPTRKEPTAEEVEAMVAEGMANLPIWWSVETRRARKLNVAAVVARGLAEARARRGRAA